jgi:hypothetical protein
MKRRNLWWNQEFGPLNMRKFNLNSCLLKMVCFKKRVLCNWKSDDENIFNFCCKRNGKLISKLVISVCFLYRSLPKIPYEVVIN